MLHFSLNSSLVQFIYIFYLFMHFIYVKIYDTAILQNIQRDINMRTYIFDCINIPEFHEHLPVQSNEILRSNGFTYLEAWYLYKTF